LATLILEFLFAAFAAAALRGGPPRGAFDLPDLALDVAVQAELRGSTILRSGYALRPMAPAKASARLRVFVGDLHGCADELEDLLAALAYDPGRHELWFVGDLVNRGPASARALRRVMQLGAGSVLGNHDLHLLAVARSQRPPSADDSFEDVLDAPDRADLLRWLETRCLVEVWDDAVLVHAGLHPRWRDPRAVAAPLEAAIARGEIPNGDSDLDFLVSVRHCDADGNRAADDTRPGTAFVPWDRHYRDRRTVICGHWAARGLVRTKRMRSLDSGCVWGGSLTAWILEEDRFVSVPARVVHRDLG
jgi:bis(5'-nucleosyl)-tetraphosphatase (symmetrical)